MINQCTHRRRRDDNPFTVASVLSAATSKSSSVLMLAILLAITLPKALASFRVEGPLVPTRSVPRIISSRWMHKNNEDTTSSITEKSSNRRDFLRSATIAGSGLATITIKTAHAQDDPLRSDEQTYFQRFPTLFDPLYGTSQRKTLRRQVGPDIWYLEQTLRLGPLETPLRCVVVRLSDGDLWVHAPLAPTVEFFQLVESCADDGRVAHVVVPTYALEHKVFVRDALRRWPWARLWTAPGQFSFPLRSASEEFVWGMSVTGVLRGSDEDDDLDDSSSKIPWTDEIAYETLTVGTFRIGGNPQTLCETAFYHKASRTLIVTDAVARINRTPPELNTPADLLLISKRSTADPLPDDTPAARQAGWEKTALLVSYFFPQHEELDPVTPGVVTWTEGWHDNFEALAGRLLVPPVVRTLLYPQDTARVRRWVDRVVQRWDFVQIVPAHWEAPVEATPEDLQRAFRWLEDSSIDAFPTEDLKRGLRPIADFVYKRSGLAARDS